MPLRIEPNAIEQSRGPFTFPPSIIATPFAATTGTTESLRRVVNSSGVVQAGFGMHDDIYVENSLGDTVLIARYQVTLNDAGSFVEDALLRWEAMVRGTMRTNLEIGGGTGRPTFIAYMPSGGFASPQASAVFRSHPGYASVGDGFGPKMLFQTVSQSGTTQNSGALAFSHSFSSGTSEGIIQVRSNQADVNVQYEAARFGAGGWLFGLTSAGVPTPTGTYMGPGSINVSDNYYRNGIPIATIYPLVAVPTTLSSPTGIYWRVPQAYVTGSLMVFLNGVAQQPLIDYQEQFAASGTYEYISSGPPTGSYQTAMFGVRN